MLPFKVIIVDLIRASHASMQGRLIKNSQTCIGNSNEFTIWGNILGGKPILSDLKNLN